MVQRIVLKALKPIVNIKKEEWPKAILMFLYFFLTITSYYIIKPVRDSFFLTKFGAQNLPYVWLATVFVLGAIVSVYVKFVDYLQKNVLLSSTVILFVSNLVVFWWLAGTRWHWLAAVFYVWVSIFNVMVVTQFWLFANDVFNPREAKRLFGFVGSGGILGGLAGGFITSQTALVVGTRNLLLVAGLILLFCVIIINIIWKLEIKKKGAELKDIEVDPAGENKRANDTKKLVKLIWTTKYLLLLVGLVCLAKMVSTLVDYQFKNIVQDHIKGLDYRTAFFGKFFAILNAASFTVQFFFTSRILKRFGVNAALLLLPCGLLFGSVAILINPMLWTAVFTMMYNGSLNYSLNQSTKELLYLPIARELRYRVKPFIDMLAYRIAKAACSILILVFTLVFHWGIATLSLVTLLLIGVWLAVIKIMKQEYVNTLRQFLIKEKVDIENDDADKAEVLFLHSFFNLLDSDSQKEGVIYSSREKRLKALQKVLEEFNSKTRQRNEDLKAILVGEPKKETVHLLLDRLKEKDAALRHIIIEALNKVKIKYPELVFNRKAIIEEIEIEIEDYVSTIQTFDLYRNFKKRLAQFDAKEEKDLFLNAQRQRINKTLERIFRLLGFLCEPADMHTVYQGFLHKDGHVRAHAIELLDNIIDLKLRKSLYSLLNLEHSHWSDLQESHKQVSETHTGDLFPQLKNILNNSSDTWGQISALYIIAKGEMKDFFTEVTQLVNSKNDLVSKVSYLTQQRLKEA